MTDSDMYTLVAPRITATHGEVREVNGELHWWDATLECWIEMPATSDTWPVNW